MSEATVVTKRRERVSTVPVSRLSGAIKSKAGTDFNGTITLVATIHQGGVRGSRLIVAEDL